MSAGGARQGRSNTKDDRYQPKAGDRTHLTRRTRASFATFALALLTMLRLTSRVSKFIAPSSTRLAILGARSLSVTTPKVCRRYARYQRLSLRLFPGGRILLLRRNSGNTIGCDIASITSPGGAPTTTPPDNSPCDPTELSSEGPFGLWAGNPPSVNRTNRLPLKSHVSDK